MHTPSEGFQTRRIILLRQLGPTPEVLLGLEGALQTLPRLKIVRGQRVAEQLTTAFRETCAIEVVSVSSFESRSQESGSEHLVYEIMESCSPHREAQGEMKWVAVDCLIERDFLDRMDFQAVQRAVEQSIASTEIGQSGPFAALGWFRDLGHWVEDEIHSHGLRLSGRFRQLNASPTFSLIRFETDGPAVWFKAVGAPNQREYTLTVALARASSRFLPKIIATRAEWKGWLSWEAEGALLKEYSKHGAWEAAARDLAKLQIDSLGTSVNLLDAGARDLRASKLGVLAEPFFQTMVELTEHQTKEPPSRLSRAHLRVLAARVADTLAVFEETEIPCTLGHLDLNPGNIVLSLTGCVFLDWAEAFVGHPFLSFEYLREHLRQTFGKDHRQEAQLLDCYISPWRGIASEGDIRRTLDGAPLVAAFACAVGNDVWMDSRRLQQPQTAGYLRSLTRRMAHEAQRLPDRRTSCPY